MLEANKLKICKYTCTHYINNNSKYISEKFEPINQGVRKHLESEVLFAFYHQYYYSIDVHKAEQYKSIERNSQAFLSAFQHNHPQAVYSNN